ncbi:DUF1648 domain-containing protein [Streptomyces sp. WAC 06738]|uniref:DUF1648 domain-containing protein n=1 Tax=Streptomyces sp. WAC 06738 TaxID=2203210 RepID=UPI0019CF64D7|nr:DUF1648 domain-containing protein [Streptomyces sp. WAC 06738]
MATDTTTAAGRQAFPWGWLVPSAVVLGAMTVWGVLRYPEVPGRVPQHIGPGGVDAWTDKSVWTVFLPVFVYAGLTLVLVACAAAAARTTPLDALPEPRDPWARAGGSMVNRPATAASAHRLARALLLLNAGLGLGFLPPCWTQWRTTQTAAVPGWILPVTIAAFVLSLVPLLLAWRYDARAKRARGRTA